MSHIWTSHVTHMNTSWHTFESVTSHVWVSHVPSAEYITQDTYTNESRQKYKWVMKQKKLSHSTHTWVSQAHQHTISQIFYMTYSHLCAPTRYSTWLIFIESWCTHILYEMFYITYSHLCAPWLICICSISRVKHTIPLESAIHWN